MSDIHKHIVRSLKMCIVGVCFFGGFMGLTRFEKGLWLCSAAAIILSYAISKSGDFLTLAASLVGVTALIFVAKGYAAGQMLTVAFAVIYGIISYHFRYYGEMITYLGMTSPIALMSFIAWIRHPYGKTREVEVQTMTKRQAAIMFTLAAAVTVGFYFILKALGNANLLFSTISVTTSFTASYLTLMRSDFYALAYAANDIVLIVLWLLAFWKNPDYLPMVVCFAAFLANDFYGFINWRKMKIRQKNPPAENLSAGV